MIRINIFLLFATLLIAACDNNKTKEPAAISGADNNQKPAIDTIQKKNIMGDIEKQKTELENMTPIPLDELKAMIPEKLMEANRTNHTVNLSMGAGLARGEYKLNDSASVSINIYDCGGPAGAGIYSMQFLSLLNIQVESDKEYTKTIDFNGSKGFEHCEKPNNRCSLSYFAGGRFLVTLEGIYAGAEELKQAAIKLNIK